MEAATLTEHAVRRIRQRCGLPHRAMRRRVETAWRRGAVVSQLARPGIVAKRLGMFTFVFNVDGACLTVLYADGRRER